MLCPLKWIEAYLMVIRLKEFLFIKKFKDDLMLNDDAKCRYWLYAPGEKARKWEQHYNEGIMAVGWDVGDLKKFNNKEELNDAVQQYYDDGKNHNKVPNVLWDFANTIKPGDIVFAKNGSHEIVGKGIVESDYIFDPDYVYDSEYEYMHVRKVKWIEKGNWPYKNGKSILPQLTLTDITSKDPERLEIIKGFFKGSVKNDSSFECNIPRNVIYFGAPGTGKSYNLNKDMEELLLINAENDYERVTFHPDYSYANFVGTYKPRPEKDDKGNKTGDITYKYVPGPFMRSLVKALKNQGKPFLLVIEEINRSNVAAVFGDVFQLLDRDDNFESEYPIETSEDMRDYLKEELGQDFEKIRIPSNMFIWATMNSADQGVYPMDTAFKRRWEFKYFGINYNDDLIKNIKFNINNHEISWNKLRNAINNELLSYGINEDKLIGPFFAFNEYLDKELSEDKFKEIFKNKIIMYLFEDAAKARRDKLFAGAKENNKNVIYSRVCELFDDIGVKIFCDNIQKELLNSEKEF